MTDLTQDELTVLMIAAEGESMMPIGRWEDPVNNLVARGYLKRNDKFNNFITTEGRKALNRDEIETTKARIETTNQIVDGREKARRLAEKIAGQLVDLANLSNKVTGDNQIEALERWSRLILTRALELLNGR